jgi:hypothetical protein
MKNLKPTPKEILDQKIKNSHMEVVRCKCGKVFAACIDGLQDAEWDKDVRKYRSQGYTSEVVPRGSYIFEKCTCKDEKPEADNDPNQLQLFN